MTGSDETLGFLMLALPFAAAVAAQLLAKVPRRLLACLLAAFPAAAFIIILSFAPSVGGTGAVLFGVDWVPSHAIRLSFRLDGLSFVFALLITGVGVLIVLYSSEYLHSRETFARFFSCLFLFMGAMLGLVLADDLVTLLVFWELTSIASFLLIGFDHHREAARRAAVQALVITGGGGLALMAGLLLVREGLGLASMTEIIAAEGALRSSGLYGPILILVLLGAFTKSAQMPFHVWLPNAMEAPTPVSAYLHSATMVKAGVYLLMRLYPALGETVLWDTILPLVGGTTLVVAAAQALRQSDLKLVLAYTTVASLGLLVMLIGVGGAAAIEASVLYLVAHTLFKASLFMVVGSIDHAVGTRDVRALGGLGRVMPITFAATLIAALSMGGMTPFLGFLAKEEIYAATATGEVRYVLAGIAAVAGNAMMVSAAILIAFGPFAGPRADGPRRGHDGSWLLWAGPLVLGLLGLFAGLFSGAWHRFVSDRMASAVLGDASSIDIGPVPHLGVPFALSVLTIVLGIALYARRDDVRRRLTQIATRVGWKPDQGFDQAMRALINGAVGLTNVLQSGRLRDYLTTTFVVVAAALLVPMVATGDFPTDPVVPALRLQEWLVVAILALGLFAVPFARTRLTAIVSLGIQGFGVALLYMVMGAPDLAFTQFMVETLSVVILTLVMTRLKLTVSDHRPVRRALTDAVIAAACGVGLGMLLLRVTRLPFDARLSDFFAAASSTIAHGRNIVNVIIVDFRAIDTLGEIAVVMTAGLAILALVRIRIGRPERHGNATTGEAP